MPPMKKDPSPHDLAALVKAILTRAREKEGFVTKTKLFKYLYLTDVEHYRRAGKSLTGFPWIFYHYGPWSQECEDFYSELKRCGEIQVKPGSRPDLETEFVDASEPQNLEDVIEDVGLELAIRRIVDRWADRALGEMLDYVYFYTEPMEGAEKGKPLDFSKVESHPEPRPVSLLKQTPNKAAVERMRKSIAEKKAAEPPSRREPFTPPPYDDVYFEALHIMEEDDGY